MVTLLVQQIAVPAGLLPEELGLVTHDAMLTKDLGDAGQVVLQHRQVVLPARKLAATRQGLDPLARLFVEPGELVIETLC